MVQILHPILCEVSTIDELMQELKARTAKHWVENLPLPVMMMVVVFIRAEQETCIDPLHTAGQAATLASH